MDGLSLLGNGIGVGGVLVWLVWMLGTDRLITGPAHRREIADKDQQISDLKDANKIKDAQVTKLADETGATMIRALESVAELARRRGGPK